MKWLIGLTGIAVLMIAGSASGDSYAVPPEVTTAVELSSTDVNRIVCPGTMNDLIFSKEKGLDGHFSGNNAFVKFKITKKGDEYIYATTPTELFVVCEGEVYSLIATPKRIPSATIRLAPARPDTLKENMTHYRDMPLEKAVLRLIREAYLEKYPPSYRISSADVPVNLSSDLITKLVRVVEVEGVGLRLKEYLIVSQTDKKLVVSEADFLSRNIGESIIGIAVEHHNLDPGDTTRVFIVEKRESRS